MMKHRLKRTRRPLVGALLLAAFLLTGLFTLGGTAAAQAAPSHAAASSAIEPAGAATSPLTLTEALGLRVKTLVNPDDPGNANSSETAQTLYSSQYRPINRWGDATTSFFTKYDGFVGTQVIDQAQRGVTQTWQMGIGNFFMSTTSNITTLAVNFDAVDQIGKAIDDISRQIVEALFTNGNGGGVVATSLIIMVVVIVVISTIVMSLRAGGMGLMIRRLAGIVVILGLLFAMASASLSGTGSTDSSGHYNPVILTPSWVVKKVNDGVSYLAAIPAQMFVTGVQPMVAGGGSASGSTPANLSCTAFTNELTKKLAAQQAAASTAGGTGLVGITAVMDQLWTDTGLRTWKEIQTGFNNPYGSKMYCRILETRSGNVQPWTSADLTAFAQPDGSWADAVLGKYQGANAPFAPDTDANEAASYVAWAACKPVSVSGSTINWQWEKGWIGFAGGTTGSFGSSDATMSTDNAQDNCSQWWGAVSSDSSSADIPAIFNISGQSGWIDSRTAKATDRDGVRDFLYALTGVNASGGSGATWAYSVSSFLQLLAFGFLAVLTFITKLFAAVFTLALWFVLLSALFSANPFKDRILRMFNRFLGVTIFASMMTVIMTFVVLFSRVLIALGDGWFGSGNIIAMVWAGFSPIAALIIVHLLFTKVFKMPSPVTIGGARAWHKSGVSGAMGAAAVGGVAAGATGLLGRAVDRGKAESRRAGSAALHRATGGKLGTSYADSSRRSGMGAGARKEARDDAVAEKVEKLTPRQVRKQAATERRTELTAARAHYAQTTGQVAPGDFRGSAAALRSRAAERTRALARNAQDKIAATPIARELHSRAEYRRALRTARTDGDIAALQEARAEQRAKLGAASAGIAAVMDAPAAVANRARLGVERSSQAARTGAQQVWNPKPIVGARADAAILAGNTRAAVNYVAKSDVGRASAAIARHGVARPVRAAAKGTAAVANRSRNNAMVLDHYRAAMAAKAAATSGKAKGREPSSADLPGVVAAGKVDER